MIRIAILLVATAAACLPAPAMAGPPVSVRAEISSERTYIGDPVMLQVIVEGSNTPQQPTLPEMKDFAVDALGGTDVSSQGLIIINGRRIDNSAQRYVFRYRLTPVRGGILKIPSIPVVVDGTTYTTSQMTLAALEPKQTDDFRLTIALSKEEAYVGEPVKATITWYLSKPARNMTFSISPLGGAADLLAAPDPRPGGAPPQQPFMQQQQQDSKYFEVPFLDGTAVGVKGSAMIDDKSFTSLTIERVVVPRKDGKLTLGPVRAAFDAVVGQRRATFFDMPFDDRSVTERTVIASAPVELSVKPLPSEGRPANFTGLIGAYSVEAWASPTTVNVGDPIALTLTVKGPDPMDLVQPLALERQRNLASGFKLPTDTVFPKIAPGTATFSYSIRARTDKATEIPPIELPYFDTQAGQYRVAASKPIPLAVRPTSSVSIAGLDEPAPPPVDEKPGGIAPIRRGSGALQAQGFDLLAMSRSPGWIAAVAGPPLVYVAAAGLVLARRRSLRDPLAYRRKRADRRAVRALSQASRVTADQVPAAVSAALRRYVADLCGRPEVGMTAEECVAFVGSTDPAGAQRLGTLLQRCETARFAPGGAEAAGPELVQQARSLVGTICHPSGERRAAA